MTTADVQYIFLTQWAICVPQSAITVLSRDVCKIKHDAGEDYFLIANGKITELDEVTVHFYM